MPQGLLLPLLACGQRGRVVHHVHSGRRCRRAPDGHRRAIAERLVKALLVVKGDPAGDPALDLAAVGVALQIDILVLERSPDAFDEDLCVTPSYSRIMRARGCCERSLLTCRYLYDR